MADSDDPDLWYPTVEDIVMIHEDIINEDPDAEPGIRDESRVQFALDYVKGEVGPRPTSIHEKAFHLMRLIASNHWFVDGNKRTALNVTELFYLVNGYKLSYGDDFRSILKLFSVRENLIDDAVGTEYFRDSATVADVDTDELDPWQTIGALIVGLVAIHSDEEPEELLAEGDIDLESLRNEFGLTTKYGTTVNISDSEVSGQDGG